MNESDFTIILPNTSIIFIDDAAKEFNFELIFDSIQA